MNTTDDNFYEEIIIKFLAGEASPEEAVLIAEWIEEPANRSVYDSILKLWNLSGENKVPDRLSSSAQWTQLREHLSTRVKSTVREIKLLRYAGIAAACAGIILLSFFFFDKQSSSNHESRATNVKDISVKSADSIRNISLADGSLIILHKNGEIRYNDSFNIKERHVQLSGESFFDIAKDESKPFIITTGGLQIKVAGTSFNVRTEAEGRSIEVQVKSGVVKMISKGQEITVNKNQTGIYFTGSRNLLVKQGIDLNSMSYATNNFQFNDIPLLDVCRYLEKSFDVRIDIDRQRYSDCRITAQFDNKSLSYILDVITATVDASYNMEDEQIYIEGKGCKL